MSRIIGSFQNKATLLIQLDLHQDEFCNFTLFNVARPPIERGATIPWQAMFSTILSGSLEIISCCFCINKVIEITGIRNMSVASSDYDSDDDGYYN